MASISPPGPRAAGRREFTETIDAQHGRIRARGHLTLHATDMLAGIAEALHRDGHDHVVVDLAEVDLAEAAALHELDALRRRLGAAGGRLTVLHAPAAPR